MLKFARSYMTLAVLLTASTGLATPAFAADAFSAPATQSTTAKSSAPTASQDAFSAPATSDVADPWEGFNRWMFAFDMHLDHYLLRPVASGYSKVTPNWGQAMVRNFFANLNDVKASVNALLQLKFAEAGSDLGRVLINTTMGVGGLFDVATHAGLKSHEQDFGLTLARWGVPTGPYLVLPFFGPSDLRDGLGMVPGRYAWPPHYLSTTSQSYLVDGAYGISKRADLLGYKKRIIGDKYIFLRNLYLNNRAIKAGKLQPEDNFGAGLDNTSDDSGW